MRTIGQISQDCYKIWFAFYLYLVPDLQMTENLLLLVKVHTFTYIFVTGEVLKLSKALKTSYEDLENLEISNTFLKV